MDSESLTVKFSALYIYFFHMDGVSGMIFYVFFEVLKDLPTALLTPPMICHFFEYAVPFCKNVKVLGSVFYQEGEAQITLKIIHVLVKSKLQAHT